MSSPRKHRALLCLEVLEDRTVPTFLYGAVSNPVLPPFDPGPGTWHQDRYRPAGFTLGQAGGGRAGVLDEFISAADGYGNRPASYSSVFYDVQGGACALAAGTTYLAVDLYVPHSWSSLNQQGPASDPARAGELASLWAAAVDASGSIVNYPEIGFNNQSGSGAGGFQIKDRTTGGWTNVGGFNGYDQWYRIGFDINSAGRFDYFVNGQLKYTDATAAGANAFSNVFLQGYNAGNSYDISWDNLRDTRATVAAMGANVSATAGAPFSGAVATFTTPDQLDSATTFTAVITWGDGSTSSGVITGGNGSFTVSGGHTYAAGGNYAVSVQISNPTTEPATANATAAVALASGLTGDTAFWLSSNGQRLINSFNGGGNSDHLLGNWLANTLPNLFGPSAGTDNLTSGSNARVLQYLQSLDSLAQSGQVGAKVQEQVLVTALNVYTTTSSLGGNTGVAYGFTVSATGLGACFYGVGNDGAAFGVANNTTLDVYQLLLAVNEQAVNGVPYNGDPTLQGEAYDLFASLT
jgi:hypothetical protein